MKVSAGLGCVRSGPPLRVKHGLQRSDLRVFVAQCSVAKDRGNALICPERKYRDGDAERAKN
jgi:hypothetical protein